MPSIESRLETIRDCLRQNDTAGALRWTESTLEELIALPVRRRRITHGRHCTCSACAREDWTNPDLAPCGMHGSDCPALYQPVAAAGTPVPDLMAGPWEWQMPNSFNSTTETDSSPPRATLMPQMTVPLENPPNNNNNGKSQRVNRVERTGETEGEESRVIHTTRARDELPVCSCGDGGAGPDLDGRCERCYGLLHRAGSAPDQR